MSFKISNSVDWVIEPDPIPYSVAEEVMQARAAEIAAGKASELIWLLEHPPLYTAGTSAKPRDLVQPNRFPVYKTGRGGQYTYHGPGQRVAYVLLDLKRRTPDVRAFVRNLEDWIIETLNVFDISGERREGRVGIWVASDRGNNPDQEEKIAAIGIRIHKWVSYHGISINVCPNLDHFTGIVPCGISDHGITSFEALGHSASILDVDTALKQTFEARFGPTVSARSLLEPC